MVRALEISRRTAAEGHRGELADLFVEYAFQVPANRIGYGHFTGYQLKIVQEVITLIVFAVFATVYLGERIRWNHAIAFAFIVCAVAAAFWNQL